MPADPSNPENWSGENKLAVVIETAALNEEQLAEYCRQKGFYAEKIVRWREAAAAGTETPGPLSAAERHELQQERKKPRTLAKELRRKDQALAETAALLVLHADNGGPMKKGATMRATLQNLGVVPSFSRPSVSDDNPYSESMFRTLRYTPAYPGKPFESIEAARPWVHRCVQWYNDEHRHSAIR